MPCGNWVPVLPIGSFDTEELAVSDVLESPKAFSALGEHPLWRRGEGKLHKETGARY